MRRRRCRRGAWLALAVGLPAAVATGATCAYESAFEKPMDIVAGIQGELGLPPTHFHGPRGLALDPDARLLYIADTANHQIRRMHVDSLEIEPVLGRAALAGDTGDKGPALAAKVRHPYGLAVDPAERRLYVTDTGNHVIRMVDMSIGYVYTVAGIMGRPGHANDNAPASTVQFTFPSALSLDLENQKLYISDYGNHAIRSFDLGTGIISTVAGAVGQRGMHGDGILATAARLQFPMGVAVDGAGGKLYLSDYGNHAVRVVDLSTGLITTVAGALGLMGTSGDGARDGPTSSSRLYHPGELVVDAAAGQLFIADRTNQALRLVDLAAQTVSTVAGRFGRFSPADAGPVGLAFNAREGVLYLSEALGHCIKRVVWAKSRPPPNCGEALVRDAPPKVWAYR